MMGSNHALSGLAAGLALAPAVGLTEPTQVIPFSLNVAGYAVFPDLDHPSSSATRVLGWVGEKVSNTLRATSAWVYERTKGSRDEPTGVHRHLSHTWIFALVVGGIATGLTFITPWAALAVYLVGAILAADRLGDWVAVPAAGGAAAAGMVMLDDPTALSWQLGAAVAAGCIVHTLGDALTVSGCPFLFGLLPFEIRGETWWEIRLLGPLSFRTNSPTEHRVVRPLLLVATVVAAWPVLLSPFLSPVLQAFTEMSA
ncbi:hypothetical protein FB384_004951 [Prauserella sediminis]|uniref:LexA-binding, inner membrane-associated hydrolase n=1 Tax=Prauserella sediminis TaxID=577680 RepID=A0A839XQ97_9PSEU|nr:metal-dependent hydrolase [Prauserella sediminis]MBB3665992.1 hypothetical protein [Prauserella sediminis]